MDRQSGYSESKASGYNWKPSNNNNPTRIAKNIKSGVHFEDSGGASRFFPQFRYSPDELETLFHYFAKPSSTERSKGCEDLPLRRKVFNGQSSEPSQNMKPVEERFTTEARNIHPTVKSLSLCRWLCRLCTPPGGTILDPFMGSGSIGVAALLEGFDFVGIEREPEYFAISEARLAWARGENGLFSLASSED
jgi:DNA modification methylase